MFLKKDAYGYEVISDSLGGRRLERQLIKTRFFPVTFSDGLSDPFRG